MRCLAILATLLLVGCVGDPSDRNADLWVAEPGLVFCYVTLADPDCTSAPVPGADVRLIAAAPQLTFSPQADPGATNWERDR